MSTKQLTERFGQSGLIGGKAEEYAYPQLLKAYDIVEDLREDKEAQYQGIDFRIKKNSWAHSYALDIKGNLHNGMFYLEFAKTYQHSTRIVPGWFHASKSDRIYHVDVEEGKLAWYGLPEMRMRLLDMGVVSKKGLHRFSIDDVLIKDLIRTTW